MKQIILILLFLLPASLAFGQCKPVHGDFSSLSKVEQARLWRDHFDNYYKTHEMNEAQRNSWVKMSEVIDPMAFTMMNDPDFLNTKFGQRFYEHYQVARKVFGEKGIQALFTLEGRESLFVTCGCSPTWTWCGIGMECGPGNGCAEIIDCGPFYQFLCSGVCREIPQQDIGLPRFRVED